MGICHKKTNETLYDGQQLVLHVRHFFYSCKVIIACLVRPAFLTRVNFHIFNGTLKIKTMYA